MSRRAGGARGFQTRGPRRFCAAAKRCPVNLPETTYPPRDVRRSSSRWSPSPSARAAIGRRTSRTLSSSWRSAPKSCSRVWRMPGCTRRMNPQTGVYVSGLPGRKPKPRVDTPEPKRTPRHTRTRPPPTRRRRSGRPRRWRVRRRRWRRWRRGRRRLPSPRRMTTTSRATSTGTRTSPVRTPI